MAAGGGGESDRERAGEKEGEELVNILFSSGLNALRATLAGLCMGEDEVSS